MKRSVLGALAVGMTAGTAFAGSSYSITPMGGSFNDTQWFDAGELRGHAYNFIPNGGPAGGPPRNLYDNIPTFFGGTSDPGLYGPFGDMTGTYLFVDWTTPTAQWGDDLHGISAGGAGPAVVTSLWYGYSLPAGQTTTHYIKIYDMVPPSTTHGTVTSAIQKGDLLTVLTVAAVGGQNFVTVGVPNLQLPHSAVWIKFEEIGGTGFPNTFWLTGGTPGIGQSNPGVTFTLKDYYPTTGGGTFTYNTWVPFPYFTFSDMMGGNLYVGSNIAVGLNGYHVPGPAAISLLGLGGLVALRRRRTR